MANYEINDEQKALTKEMRMIEVGDPVHADVYNSLFAALINNDVFLEKLANKMIQQVMISHVMDSTNSNMVLGADQGPVITKLIDEIQKQVTVLTTKAIYLPNNQSITLKSTKSYDVIFLIGQIGGKALLSIIPLHTTDSRTINLGEINIIPTETTVNTTTFEILPYFVGVAIGFGQLSYTKVYDK